MTPALVRSRHEQFIQKINDLLQSRDPSCAADACPSAQISLSELVDEAVRLMMREDQEDLAAFEFRAAEPEFSYEALLSDLKANGKL